MAIFNSDEAEGKWEQAKGTVKDKVGEATTTSRVMSAEVCMESSCRGNEHRACQARDGSSPADLIDDDVVVADHLGNQELSLLVRDVPE